jgi:hypothetical protein
MDGADMQIDIEKLSETDRTAHRKIAQDLVQKLRP